MFPGLNFYNITNITIFYCHLFIPAEHKTPTNISASVFSGLHIIRNKKNLPYGLNKMFSLKFLKCYQTIEIGHGWWGAVAET